MKMQLRQLKKQNIWCTACLAVLIAFVIAVVFGLFSDSREDNKAYSIPAGMGITADLRSGRRPVTDDRICVERNNGVLCVWISGKEQNRRDGARAGRQWGFSVEAMLRRTDSGIIQGMDLANLRLLQQGRPEEQLLLVENVRLLI